MVLQKQLKLFRFINQNPHGDESHKYDYQLYKNRRLVKNLLSNHECSTGKVVISDDKVLMDLICSTSQIDFREMEENNVYLVPVTVKN